MQTKKILDKWWLKCLKCILQILHSSDLWFWSYTPVKFAFFWKGSQLVKAFYCCFCLEKTPYGSVTQKLKKFKNAKFYLVIV